MKGEFMIFRKLLKIGAAAALALTVTFPSQTVYAGQFMEEPGLTPRYQSICTIGINASPGTSQVTYKLLVDGINADSLSGTISLYKKNSSGNYIKTDAEKINLQGPFLFYSYNSYFQLDGKGEYKISFSGFAYANGESERINDSTKFVV